MKTLIVEDEFTSRALLLRFLAEFGPCEVAVNGVEALAAIKQAFISNEPYDLICLDIEMPQLDGYGVLRSLREIEEKSGVLGTDSIKVIMTSANRDAKGVLKAFREGCEAYLSKPIVRKKLIDELVHLNLIENEVP